MIDVSKEPTGAFTAAMKTTKRGDKIAYHVGEFAAGAHRQAAYKAYEKGQVLLVQRRLEHSKFEFLAIRTGKK